MTAHTPGRWEVRNGSVYTTTGTPIAHMDRRTFDTSPVERDANARLIAAAPDLLGSALAVLGVWDADGNAAEIAAAISYLRAATRKAVDA